MSLKRAMAEIRARGIGIDTEVDNGKGRVRIGRNSLYRLLAARGYEWNPKYSIWTMEIKNPTSEILEQQQAEIERLEAENQKLIDNCFYLQGQYELAVTGEIAKPEPPQESYVPMTDEDYADFYERVVKGRVPQESLKVRILRYLAACTSKVTYGNVYSGIGEVACLSKLSDLRREGLIEWLNGFQITAAGRDYLAALDI